MGRGYEQTFFQRRYTEAQQAHEKMYNITNYQGYSNQNYNERSPYTCQNGYNSQDKKLQMLERIRRKENPHTLLEGMQTGAATKENSMENSQKVKNRNTIHSSYPTTGYLFKEIEINNSKRFTHPCVYCDIIHNS